MKKTTLATLTFLLLLGCQHSDTNHQAPRMIHNVTLVSHLGGALDDDPKLVPGRTIRVNPHESEPPSGRTESIVVQLPFMTPFDGPDEQYFLRGYAIGKLSSHNITFL